MALKIFHFKIKYTSYEIGAHLLQNWRPFKNMSKQTGIRLNFRHAAITHFRLLR